MASTHQLAKLSLLTGFSQCQLSFVIWCTVFIYHGHQGPGLQSHCITFVHFLPPLGQPALKILFPLCYSSVLFFLETWPQDSSYKFLIFFSFIEAPQLQHLLESSMHTSSKCMSTLRPFSQCPLLSSFQQHPHLSKLSFVNQFLGLVDFGHLLFLCYSSFTGTKADFQTNGIKLRAQRQTLKVYG